MKPKSRTFGRRATTGFGPKGHIVLNHANKGVKITDVKMRDLVFSKDEVLRHNRPGLETSRYCLASPYAVAQVKKRSQSSE